MVRRANKKKPRLHVMFDTNVLFTQVESDLVRHDVNRIIKENSSHLDLQIEWHLPQVVIGERRYQMLKRASMLLPNMQKLEKLIGHSFGIDNTNLELYVDKAISDGVNACNFKIAQVDTSAVDWEKLISRSVNRKPPFEDNEKEKGFRDAVIAHTFFDLFSSSPTTPSVCLLALVSEDSKLCEYVQELTESSKNVRILSNLSELESLINTLVSTVPEELVNKLTEKADMLFFEEDNDKTLYYKEQIREKITSQFSKELSDIYLERGRRQNSTYFISPAVFIKKVGRFIHWMSLVEVEFELYHFEELEAPPMREGLGAVSEKFNLPYQGLQRPTKPQEGIGLLGLAAVANQKKVVDYTGRDRFEIHWKTSLTEAYNLTSARLENIEYLGNDIRDYM